MYSNIDLGDEQFKAPSDFWRCLEETIHSSYLKRKLRSERELRDYKNWECIMFSYFQMVEGSDSIPKKLQKEQLSQL
jgi:hypothetical protein